MVHFVLFLLWNTSVFFRKPICLVRFKMFLVAHENQFLSAIGSRPYAPAVHLASLPGVGVGSILYAAQVSLSLLFNRTCKKSSSTLDTWNGPRAGEVICDYKGGGLSKFLVFIRHKREMCPGRPEVLPDVREYNEGTIGAAWQSHTLSIAVLLYWTINRMWRWGRERRYKNQILLISATHHYAGIWKHSAGLSTPCEWFLR